MAAASIFVEFAAPGGHAHISAQAEISAHFAVPISVEETGKRITILPDDSFRLTCDTFFQASHGGRASHSKWK